MCSGVSLFLACSGVKHFLATVTYPQSCEAFNPERGKERLLDCGSDVGNLKMQRTHSHTVRS